MFLRFNGNMLLTNIIDGRTCFIIGPYMAKSTAYSIHHTQSIRKLFEIGLKKDSKEVFEYFPIYLDLYLNTFDVQRICI